MKRFISVLVVLCSCATFDEPVSPTSVVGNDLCVDEGLCNLEELEDAAFQEVNVMIKLDCEQVGAFRKDDICVSNCTLCSSQEICIDTNGDKFNDTCVQGETPVEPPPPAREPPPAVPTKKVLCGGIEIELGVPCSGAFGACAENGVVECVDKQWTCSTDVKGSQSLATDEVCGDNIDQNCNGIVDDTCSKPIDLSEEDKDEDGVLSKVDCDDTNPKIGVEFPNCKEVKKTGHFMVIAYDAKDYYGYGVYYREVVSQEDFASAETDWNNTSFGNEKNFTEVSLQSNFVFLFNITYYAGGGLGAGWVMDKKTGKFSSSSPTKIPKIYEVTDGKWTDKIPDLYGLCTLTKIGCQMAVTLDK